MIDFHFEGIRSTAQYSNACIFVYPESNNNVIEANKVRDIVQKTCYAPVFVEYQHRQGKPRIGVLTRPEDKKQCAEDLARVMSDGLLSFPENNKLISGDPQGCKDMLIQQLRHYRKEEKITNRDDPAFAQVKEMYSGKAGGRKDDLAMALQLVLHHGAKKRLTDEYERLSAMNGWRS